MAPLPFSSALSRSGAPVHYRRLPKDIWVGVRLQLPEVCPEELRRNIFLKILINSVLFDMILNCNYKYSAIELLFVMIVHSLAQQVHYGCDTISGIPQFLT